MIALLSLVLACSSPDPIVGTWSGQSTLGQQLTLDFKADKALKVVYAGSASRSGTWTVDRSKAPIHLDLNLDDRDPLRTIVRFPDPDTLVYVEVGSADERPTSFDGVTMVFRRQAPASP